METPSCFYLKYTVLRLSKIPSCFYLKHRPVFIQHSVLSLSKTPSCFYLKYTVLFLSKIPSCLYPKHLLFYPKHRPVFIQNTSCFMETPFCLYLKTALRRLHSIFAFSACTTEERRYELLSDIPR
jgi:hypothetical protein